MGPAEQAPRRSALQVTPTLTGFVGTIHCSVREPQYGGSLSVHIAYFDESGDDGHPKTSSHLFVLSSCYLHYLNWRRNYDFVREFRRELRDSYGIPVKWELHARPFLLNKNPFRALSLSDTQRVEVISLFCDVIAQMDVRIVNVAIVKPRIRRADYDVLSRALTYSIQRIENDLDPIRNPTRRFLIITDTGRVGKMTRTSRRIQVVNYIPSKYGPKPYRQEIRSLIEDPLPKESKESYFIQMSDLVAFIVYLYCLGETQVAGYRRRLAQIIDPAQVADWMDRLLPSLNTEASGDNPYGIVLHPKE
jgi:hypothetical protein